MKRQSRILTEAHETATALHRSGAIDKQTMREFDALCLLTVRELSPRQIRSLRTRTHMSQSVFAALLNTSASTVQKWEAGEKRPGGPSLKLIDILWRKGVEVLA